MKLPDLFDQRRVPQLVLKKLVVKHCIKLDRGKYETMFSQILLL